MGGLSKRKLHLKKARAARKCEQKTRSEANTLPDEIDEEARLELQEAVHWEPPEASIPAAVHWAGVDDGDLEEDDCEVSEAEENEEEDAFAVMMARAKKGGAKAFESTNFKYQRGPELSSRQKKRKRDAAQELDEAAMDSRPLNKGFLVKKSSPEATEKQAETRPNCWISREKMLLDKRKEMMEKLDKKLRSAKTDLIAQNLTRHRAVLAFMRMQSSKKLGKS
jgi:hypothetical protein